MVISLKPVSIELVEDPIKIYFSFPTLNYGLNESREFLYRACKCLM